MRSLWPPVAGVDYVSARFQLVFPPSQLAQCGIIHLVNDEILEAPAVFYVNLLSEDSDLVVAVERATVVIKDGDGKKIRNRCTDTV